jgi:luciferase-like monooxygenase
MRIGYFLSCEEYSPRELLDQARLAERHGFHGLWISDHYHPWIEAQGQSTAVMLEGRFALGVGSGEALNEHIFGDPWPRADVRLDMLEEAVEIMRELWTGRRVSFSGDKPVHAGTKVCYGDDEAERRRTAHRIWPNENLPGELAQVLPEPAHFEQASELVTEQMIGEAVPCGPDLERHVAALQQFADAGVDELYVQQIGGNTEAFFAAYEREVLPRFH